MGFAHGGFELISFGLARIAVTPYKCDQLNSADDSTFDKLT